MPNKNKITKNPRQINATKDQLLVSLGLGHEGQQQEFDRHVQVQQSLR